MDPLESKKMYQLIGKRIAEKRKILVISQDELSNVIGISRGSIANIEKGRQAAPLHLMIDICAALNVDVRDIIPSRQEYCKHGSIEFVEKLNRRDLSQSNKDILHRFFLKI